MGIWVHGCVCFFKWGGWWKGYCNTIVAFLTMTGIIASGHRFHRFAICKPAFAINCQFFWLCTDPTHQKILLKIEKPKAVMTNVYTQFGRFSFLVLSYGSCFSPPLSLFLKNRRADELYSAGSCGGYNLLPNAYCNPARIGFILCMLSWFQVLMPINRIDVILFYIEYSNLLSEQIDI